MKAVMCAPLLIALAMLAPGAPCVAEKPETSQHAESTVLLSPGEEGGGWLGVEVQEITDGLREAMDLGREKGVLVSEVIEGSPAEKAGLQKGDVILKIDDHRVAKPRTLVHVLQKLDPGDEVAVEFVRDGKSRTEKVTLGERKAGKFPIEGRAWRPKSMEVFRSEAGPRLGVTVLPIDHDLAPYFRVSADEGVLVTGVKEDSPAEKAEIRSGDVILSVDGETVRSAEDIRDRIADREAGDKVDVGLVRKGEKMTVSVELEEGPDFSGHAMLPMDNLRDLQVFREALPQSDELREEVDHLRAEVQDLREELTKLREEIREHR
jgi:C-terminal processing protease CtpA/Prc